MMGVMMQAFYWDCPREEKKEYQWWKVIQKAVPSLAKTGFSSLWLPPAHKAGNLDGTSMGYDPYDYYDLGDFDQKGSIPTWFGTKNDLLNLIKTAHKHDLSVIADMVINHNNGADGKELNPITGEERWTLFTPKSGALRAQLGMLPPQRLRTLGREHLRGYARPLAPQPLRFQ